jgi:RNA polymerase sigma factor (sigma-70 family)
MTEAPIEAPAAPAAIDATWQAFKALQASGDDPAELERLRNILLENYLYLVKRAAKKVVAKARNLAQDNDPFAERLSSRPPCELEKDDLVSAGICGLMDAIKSFEPARGVKFETFCYQRVKGAMLDELRSLDWVPRSDRDRADRIGRIRVGLLRGMGQMPSNDDIFAVEAFGKLDPTGVKAGRRGAEQMCTKFLELRQAIVDEVIGELRDASTTPGACNLEEAISVGCSALNSAILEFDRSSNGELRAYLLERVRMALGVSSGGMDAGRRAVTRRRSYRHPLVDSRPVGTVSLNRKWFETESDRNPCGAGVIRDDPQADPPSAEGMAGLRSLLSKELSRNERLIIVLYYYEEMTMKEIGMTLELSESRVSQLHSGILARMSAQLQRRIQEL